MTQAAMDKDTMVAVTLKPCPFCGGEASADGHIRYSKPLADTWWEGGLPITEAFYVNCIKCGAVSRSGLVSGYQTKAEAIERWNTRHRIQSEGRTGAGGGALASIAAERKRQIESEGWTADHDDEHADCQMAGAAACYAMSAIPHWAKHEAIRLLWPWSKTWWKPRSHRENLVRAGALIVAEIERIDRAALSQSTGAGEDGA